MPDALFSREQVASHLQVSVSQLTRYEARGLIRPVKVDGQEGYEPHEIRKVWSVVSLHKDAGINLAGIEAILRMREQFGALHDRLAEVTEQLRELIETDPDAPRD